MISRRLSHVSVNDEAILDIDGDNIRQLGGKVDQAKAAGRKILILTLGSRGDVQPCIALGRALKESGFVVKFGTNVNHIGFVEKFDLDAEETAPDIEIFLQEDAVVREAMAKGDIATFADALGRFNLEHADTKLKQKVELIQRFQPDVLLLTPLEWYDGSSLARHFNIPYCCIMLQLSAPSKNRTTMIGEPAGCPHRMLGTLVLKLFHDSEKLAKEAAMLKNMPELKPSMIHNLREFLYFMMHPISPMIVGFSPSLYDIEPDWPEDLRKQTLISGFWVVGKEEQKKRLQRRDSKFGGADLGELSDFLAEGEPPVYMGWGSMIAVSAEHMTCLAVRALMQSKSRGIILGGWAGLEEAKLQGQADTKQMLEYSKNNVLFLKTAPHEWLFPQCACTVHHGGSGTTAAALRAGRPTIITPCFVDQFDNAKLVAKAGAGVEMKQFSKVTAKALANAISGTKLPKMVEAARILGDKLQMEDGLKNATKRVDDWIINDIDTGKYAVKIEQQKNDFQKMRSQGNPSCFWWLGRLCCLCDAANNYKP